MGYLSAGMTFTTPAAPGALAALMLLILRVGIAPDDGRMPYPFMGFSTCPPTPTLTVPTTMSPLH